jgi:hypothetical protein
MDDLIRVATQPFVVGPLVAVATVALTVLACELLHRDHGTWRWRAVTAWGIPAATTVVMIVALARVDLEGTGALASILSLFAAIMGNFGQWLVIIRSAGDRSCGPVARPGG